MQPHLWPFHGGLHLEGHKNLSNMMPIVQAKLPKFLVLPLLQHIGDPTEPVVQVGDKVLKGQVIAHSCASDCSLQMSAPIHASSSGTVIAIEPRPIPHPSDLKITCIVIETDGEETWAERHVMPHYTKSSPKLILDHIAKSGIVGLGGAGFPSHIKLRPEGIDTLIINGAECEPYITCDDRLMREYPNEIIEGAHILKHVVGGAKHCIIAVEDNKPEAYQALTAVIQGNIEIVKVPTCYPTGGERQLIQVLTGKEIRRSQLPATMGIIMHNIETTRAIYRAINEGRPLISRVVTVTGTGIEKPQNLEVLLGTPVSAVLDQCGRMTEIDRLIMGGTMMGVALPHEEFPVIKTTNCLIAARSSEIQKRVPMPCIRCGACAQVCPIQLLPQQLYWYAKAKDFKKVQEYHIFECIDCGCCAYVCPSHLPLVDYYRYAKAEIRATERERKRADQAKQRHEFRTFRLEREKSERLIRHRQASCNEEDKKADIQTMLEQVKMKKIG